MLSSFYKETPNIANACHQGYNQTYLIKTTGDVDKNDTCASRDAFLRCGNWCYSGQVKISYQQAFETSLKGRCVVPLFNLLYGLYFSY